MSSVVAAVVVDAAVVVVCAFPFEQPAHTSSIAAVIRAVVFWDVFFIFITFLLIKKRRSTFIGTRKGAEKHIFHAFHLNAIPSV